MEDIGKGALRRPYDDFIPPAHDLDLVRVQAEFARDADGLGVAAAEDLGDHRFQYIRDVYTPTRLLKKGTDSSVPDRKLLIYLRSAQRGQSGLSPFSATSYSQREPGSHPRLR